MDISRLRKKLAFLNKAFWPGFYIKPWIDFINKSKRNCFIKIFEAEIQPLIKKYESYSIQKEPIGNRVWVFWYTGLESAPQIVKKCIEEMRKITDIDLVFLDKTNLDQYFIWNSDIKSKFENGKISVTFLTDIIRNQLMARYGGFWFDSTLLFLDKDFIIKHRDLSYYSLKHSDYAACSHFNEGKWSSFLSGTQKNHLLPAFTTDLFEWYFSKYDEIPDYFFIDYAYCLIYEKFPEIRLEIDSLESENRDVFYIGRNIRRKCSDNTWNKVISQNKVQKLIWRIDNPEELLKHKNGLYYRVLNYGRK